MVRRSNVVMVQFTPDDGVGSETVVIRRQGKHGSPPSLIDSYHAHWKEFHQKTDPSLAWLKNWFTRIPGLCSCKQTAGEILDRCPPRFDDWFAYSVEFHNEVNKELDRPLVLLEEARLIWLGADLTAS